MTGNTADLDGGGVYAASGTTRVDGTSIAGNTPNDLAGGGTVVQAEAPSLVVTTKGGHGRLRP